MSSSDGSEISFQDDSGSGSGLFGDTPFEKDWEDLDEEEQGACPLRQPALRRPTPPPKSQHTPPPPPGSPAPARAPQLPP